MDLGFRGEVADYYHRFRRGYPPPVVDSLVRTFALTPTDVTVDLGCGTGQLTLPLAKRVRSVVAMDPEPDMLQRARQAAHERGTTNVTWTISTDNDIPTVGTLVGHQSLAAVTVGQALHWMDHERLFHATRPFLRPGGGVAVITNGTPLWLQDTAWSHALRGFLENWLGRAPTGTCGTDEASQQRYRDSLIAAGYEVSATTVNYTDDLDTTHIIGGVYSALPVARLPTSEQRPHFAQQLHDTLEPHQPFTEQVKVTILTGHVQRETSLGRHQP